MVKLRHQVAPVLLVATRGEHRGVISMPPQSTGKKRNRVAGPRQSVCETCTIGFVATRGSAGRFCSRACFWVGHQFTESVFWGYVDSHGPVPESRPDLGECWLWKHTTRRGYGLSTGLGIHRTGKQEPAHRVAWKIEIGPIPEGLTLDHLCRVTMCVRPAHMEPVPSGVNAMRGDGPSAQNARKTHCKRGHQNWALGSGGRYCRTCVNDQRRERRQKNRLECQ